MKIGFNGLNNFSSVWEDHSEHARGLHMPSDDKCSSWPNPADRQDKNKY